MNNKISFWNNEITKTLSIQYPIIQAPMLGVTTPNMVASAAKSGCLGTLALGDLPPDQCLELIQSVQQKTHDPFAVNFFVYDIPPVTEDLKIQYRKTKKYIEDLISPYHFNVELPDIENLKTNSYHDQLDAFISAGCRIISFTFGNLDAQSIEKCKEKGIILIGTCTSVEEAIILEKSGIDIICVQGYEAGGHRGSFSSDPLPQIGGFSLLPQIRDHVKVPLIYAGGLYDANTICAASQLGAQGFQLGSILLASQESALQDFEKQKLQHATSSESIITKSFSGRAARGIKNLFTLKTDNTDLILPYPYQNKLTAPLRKAAKSAKNTDFISLWTGQSIAGYPYSENSTKEIFINLVHDLKTHIC